MHSLARELLCLTVSVHSQSRDCLCLTVGVHCPSQCLTMHGQARTYVSNAQVIVYVVYLFSLAHATRERSPLENRTLFGTHGDQPKYFYLEDFGRVRFPIPR